jgi:hypothetical protein
MATIRGLTRYVLPGVVLMTVIAGGWLTGSSSSRTHDRGGVTGAKRDESVERVSERGRGSGGLEPRRAAAVEAAVSNPAEASPKLTLAPAELAVSPPKAVAHWEGIPAPGRRILLQGEGSVAAQWVRWVQTQGPAVAIESPTSRSTGVTVPQGASLLGFTFFVANSLGTDATSLVVRVTRPDGVPVEPSLRADAGDDQVGIVGRQITLNGSRSEPRGQVGYRWFQVAGPRVRLDLDDGYIYSFVPQAPGVYQFALVVALGSEMSRPHLVTVSIGNPASPFGLEPARDAPEALHDVARAALATVPGGIDVAQSLAEAFDGIADRMDLYHSYAEAYSELCRRLELVLPPDPVRRAVWDERLFAPLTARLVDGMRAEGLDFRRPDAQSMPLTSGQRAKLAELFRSMSRGFRATQPGR